MKRSLGSLLVFLTLILVVGSAQAGLIGPEYPAPGNNFFSGTGSSGGPGGQTNTYWGFDSTEYSALYWGPWEGALLGVSLDGSTITGQENMVLSSFNNTVAIWTGTSTLYSGYGYTLSPVNTRLTITLAGLASFIDAAAVDKASLGVLAAVQGNYSANILFEAKYSTGSWMPITTDAGIYNLYHGIGGTKIEFSGGFYSEAPVATPEPTSMLLLGSGLVGMAALRRKIKS